MDSRSLWEELLDLMEQARTEFGNLRDLPPYGRKQWERYFQKAFQVYARLWSFQQDNRLALQSEGLKRWEIGEVASRIGQLYYNYYLRTSGLNFLSESYVFYEAIHERGYLESDDEEDLLVKQLRFYTRFITVCLLLGKRDEVWEHLEKLQQLVEEFASEAQVKTSQANKELLPAADGTPTDVLEWRMVTQEMEHFLAADSPVSSPLEASRHAVALPIRCQLESPLAGIPFTAPFLTLYEAVLASYWHRQVKLGDLPLDSFRMLQALEWEDPTARESFSLKPRQCVLLASRLEAHGPPQGGMQAPPWSRDVICGGSVSPDDRHNGEYWARGTENGTEHENPAKYMLYRPTASELLAVLATSCEALPPVSAILVYISAAEEHVRGQNTSASRQQLVDGSKDTSPECSQDGGEEVSGVCLSPPSSSGLDESYLYPEDILPHTRRPLFLVIDSDNSRAFRALAGRERSYPPCCLMSPIAQPPGVCVPRESGRLFTLFLTSPVMAMCALVDLKNADGLMLATCQRTVEAALFEIGEDLALSAGNEWNDPWVGMFGDVLLRRLILHFLLCRAALALHNDYSQVDDYQPTCFPPLPQAASTTADAVVNALHLIAEAMGCGDKFNTAGPSRQKSFSETDSWEAGLRNSQVLSLSSLPELK